MFLRVWRPKEDKEMLINVNSIWKIEVMYGERRADGSTWVVSLEDGLKNPNAVRFYKLFFGGEEVLLPSAPDDPVVKVIEGIYKDAVKG